jgi:tetratricopeptide (TPR) repeat protein
MRQCFFIVVIIHILLYGCSTPKKGTLGALVEKKITINADAPFHVSRKKAMKSYSQYVDEAALDSLRVEALRRLADIELEKSEERYQEQLEKRSAEKLLSATEQVKLKGVTYEKAIKLYERALAASGRSGDFGDAAILYQLSSAYEQIGQPKKALNALDRLLEKFPAIDDREKIHFRRGELLLEIKDYRKAEMAYTQAMLVSTSSTYYDRALSQRGWTAYKQKNYTKALYSYFNFIDHKLAGLTGNSDFDISELSKRERHLVEHAFLAVTLSFIQLGGPEAIEEHFRKFGRRRYESEIYKSMGEYFLDKQRYLDAAKSYTDFVKYHNDHRLTASFEMSAIKILQAGGFLTKVLNTKITFSDKYRANGSYWKLQTKEDQKKLGALVAKNIEDISSHFHAMAQKSKAPADFKQAIKWYRKYLASFAKFKQAPQINFLLAESLFELNQFEAAIEEYEKTAYGYPKFQSSAEAAYAAIVAYPKLVSKLNKQEKKVWADKAVKAALRFGTTFPSDTRALTAVVKAAEDLFAQKKYQQAEKASRIVLGLKSKTNTKVRRNAWLIIAQSEFQKGRYAQAESNFKVALKLVENDKKVRKSIVEGLVASIYKRGEQLRESGDLKGSIKVLSQVSAIAPKSNVNITAHFDIALGLIQLEDWRAAELKFKQFRKNFPNHPLQVKVAENLARVYLKINKPLLAAQEFERLVQSKNDSETKRNILLRAAELYEQAGAVEQLLTIYKRYNSAFPSPFEPAMEVREKLAQFYKIHGPLRNYHFWLRKIIKADKSAGNKATSRTKYLTAKAAYNLAEPAWLSFQAIRLVVPLKKTLPIKKRHMTDAVAAYTRAADYGVQEFTTASVYHLGEIYNRFGQDLLNSARPQGLTSEEREQYDILLEEQVFPFEEKSINIHESNAQRVKLGIYDEWVQKSFAALKMLRPVTYGKIERSELVANELY